MVNLEGGQLILRELRDPKESGNWATPSNCQVIVFTARGDSQALEEIENLIGENGKIVHKPVLPEELVAEVSIILLNKGENEVRKPRGKKSH